MLHALTKPVYDQVYKAFLTLVEANIVPTCVLRVGIRYLLKTKCLFHFKNTEDELAAEMEFVKDLRVGFDNNRTDRNSSSGIKG